MARSRKRIRKLSTAVFRGMKTEFTFDVYPISPEITDNAGVFIFSRRTVDKFGRWHHVVSCVGETASIVSEIRKHRRSKCVKTNQANVVCLIKEADRSARKSALEDIVTARTFSCVQGVYKSGEVKARLAGKPLKTAKILPFKPAIKTRKTARMFPPPAKPDSKRTAANSNNGRKAVVKPEPKRSSTPARVKRKPITRSAKSKIHNGSGSRTKLAA